jgi:hypothetical protein
VPESKVPDNAIWWADWLVMSDEAKALHWNDFDEFEGFKERQKALRKSELSDEFWKKQEARLDWLPLVSPGESS